MKTQGFNLFIVDDNALALMGLRNYLQTRFGPHMNIFTFLTGAKALEKVDKDTGIVILDYYLENENGNEVLKSIKQINPSTEVIMLTSNEEIGVAIESFRKGANDFVIKGDKAWKRIGSSVNKIITYPYRMLVKEFGVHKFLAIFLLTFATMGLAVYVTLQFINQNN
jgi:DNA-binding NarL/FixJ family response regulator